MGEEEINLIRKKLGWNNEPFDIPEKILNLWKKNGLRNIDERKSWEKIFSNSVYYQEITDLLQNKHVLNIEEKLESYKENISEDSASIATRKSSENVLNELTVKLSNLIGGSADLTGSNNTLAKGQNIISSKDFTGSYILWNQRTWNGSYNEWNCFTLWFNSIWRNFSSLY